MHVKAKLMDLIWKKCNSCYVLYVKSLEILVNACNNRWIEKGAANETRSLSKRSVRKQYNVNK